MQLEKEGFFEARTSKNWNTRGDHYDGQSSLYRLSAVIFLENDLSSRCSREKVEILVETSKSWSVNPSEIVVFTNRIELHWYAKDFQIVSTQEQYLALIIEFVSFIDGTRFPGLKFLERCLIEDPNRRSWGVPNETVQFNPEFTASSFHSSMSKPDVLFLNERLEVVA